MKTRQGFSIKLPILAACGYILLSGATITAASPDKGFPRGLEANSVSQIGTTESRTEAQDAYSRRWPDGGTANSTGAGP